MKDTKKTVKKSSPGLAVSRSFWLSLAGALAVLAAAAVYLTIQSEDSSPVANVNVTASPAPGGSGYEEQLKEKWNAINTVSAELIKKEQGVIDQATLTDFSASVGVTEKRIDGARKEIEAIPSVPENYRDRQLQLVAAISSLQNYLRKLQGLVGKQAADVKQEEFSPVDSAGSDAKKKTDLAVDEMVFIERLPGAIFTLQTDLLALYQSVWLNESSGQRSTQGSQPRPQPSAPSAPAPSAQTGAAGPTETIMAFGESYVAQDVNGMSRMIYERQAADDFSAQSSDAYPYSYEILEGPTVQGDNYVYRVMFLFKGEPNPFLEDWTMIVTQKGPSYYITGVNLELRSGFTDN